MLVVGGGIAGVSVAWELAAHARVVLTEAEQDLPVHSTARSAATYIPGHGSGPVRALIDASGPRFAALPEQLGTPPLLSPRPVLHLADDEQAADRLATTLREQHGEPGAPVALDPAQAWRRAPVLRRAPRAAAWTAGACDVDTAALHDGYRRGLRARGGTVLRGARVAALDRDGSGWSATTTAGHRVRAEAVVDAAGAWADAVAALAGVPGAGLTPYRRTIAACPVGDPSVLAVDGGVLPMIADAAERWYLKAEADIVLVSRPTRPRPSRATRGPRSSTSPSPWTGWTRRPRSGCGRSGPRGRGCGPSPPTAPRCWARARSTRASSSSPGRAGRASSPPRRWRRWPRRSSWATRLRPTSSSTPLCARSHG